MTERSSRAFWVIFDTGVRPPYYKDVHASLAVPPGWLLRYNYSKTWLTTKATTLSDDFASAPRKVLLVYAQYERFQQGEDVNNVRAGRRKLWVPTRFAELVGIERIGEDYHYDLKMESYPYFDEPALARILSGIETPFEKLVAVSTAADDLAGLEHLDKPDENWEAIVKWFHQNSQFAEDAFWRLSGPFHRGSKTLVRPKLRPGLQNRSTVIPVQDGDRIYFAVTGKESRSTSAAGGGAAVRTIQFEKPSECKFIELETPYVALRQYDRTEAGISVHSETVMRTRECTVTLKTNPQSGAFVVGPEIDVVFSLGRNVPRILLGCVAGLVGAVSMFVASTFDAVDPIARVTLFAGGVVAASVFYWLIKREVQIKL